MIISKKSWHYRWMQWLEAKLDIYRDDSKSLCQYFWRFVFLHFRAAFFATAIAGLISLLPLLAWSGFRNHSKNAQVIFGAIMAGIALIFIAALVFDTIDKLKYKLQYRRNGFLYVTTQAFKAMKTKVCPLIEYKE